MNHAVSDSHTTRHQWVAFALMFAFFAIAPYFVYPVFLMKVMCFALFACAFNLLIGFGGLLSFGHAMFLGFAGYVSAHTAKVWGRLHAEIEKVRAGCSRGKHCIGWREVRIR